MEAGVVVSTEFGDKFKPLWHWHVVMNVSTAWQLNNRQVSLDQLRLPQIHRQWDSKQMALHAGPGQRSQILGNINHDK